MPTRVVFFETTEGTFINVDVSPDGETLIFDLLGDIYWLPIQGGDAVPITSGRAWDQAARFSPDGAHVYFLSDRAGHKNIWRVVLADESLQQVTRSESDIVGGPNWSYDGSHLLASLADAETGNTEFILQSIDPHNGTMAPIDAPSRPWIDLDTYETFRRPIQVFSGAESADGHIYFSRAKLDEDVGRITVRMYELDLHTKTRTAFTRVDASYGEFKPQISHDGHLLAYFRQYNDRRTEIRIRNLTTGQDDAVVELTNVDDATYTLNADGSRPNYAFTPDDRHLVFWHDGKIHRVTLEDGSNEIVPFRVKVEREVWARVEPTVQHLSDHGEAKIIRWSSVSRDGQTMAFAAIGYVWVMDLKTGDIRRLTNSSNFEFMPVISPDGRSIAYVSFAPTGNDYRPSRLIVAEIDDGTQRTVLGASNETYLLPQWSQDGQKIAVIKEVEKEGRLDATFGWTPAVSGEFHAVAPAPASSEYLGVFVYARFVSFDKSGRHLLFSYLRSRNETVLATASLDGSQLRTLAIGTPEIAGITPAPDLNNLALTRRDGTVWVVPFAIGEEQSVSTLAPDANLVSDGGGYYVNWNRPRHLTFGFAQNVYRYRLDDAKLESLRVKVAFPKPKAEQPIAFKGARLITLSDDTGAGPVIESGTVVVGGTRIAAIGPVSDVVIPSGALVIDVTGKTIMPGLLDTHYHRIGGSGGVIGVSALKLPNPNFSDRSAIAYGVTTAWEPGGAANDGVPATADLRAAGRIVGPRWSHSAMGGVGYPWERPTDYTYDDALAAVVQHLELGVAVLKEYNTPTRQQRQWLSAAARQVGLGIVSHIVSFEGMMTRIVDGYTGGDHPRIPVPFYKDVHELLRQTGYIWTPNVIITPGTVGPGQLKKDYFCYAVLDWRNRRNPGGKDAEGICPAAQSAPTVPYDILRFSRVARQAALAASDGVHIGVSAHGMPGSKLHQEMWYLWKGGMPVEDVLHAATIGNAEKLGLQEEIGSLGPGKIADFLVLNANPLDDILNTLSLEYTIQGGVVYDSDTTIPVDLNSIRETVAITLHEDN